MSALPEYGFSEQNAEQSNSPVDPEEASRHLEMAEHDIAVRLTALS